MESPRSDRNAFLYGAWYCAGWAHDLGRDMVSRTMLEIPVLLFRKEDGTPVATKDECPHRFAPLSMGRIQGDRVICGYHGLSFSADGGCDDPRYPEKGRKGPALRTFPIVERHNILWIWMGEPAVADPACIPDFGFLQKDELPKFFGYTHVNANYQLEADNLLDLSHLDYVHASTIAQDMSRFGAFSVESDGDRVSTSLRAEGAPMPALWSHYFPGAELADCWMDVHWRPASAIVIDTGTKLAGAPRDEALGTLQAHFATPETRYKTHYFWSITTHPALGPNIDLVLQDTLRAFESEDQPMIEAVQRRMGEDDFWRKGPLILPADGGGVRARRILERLIKLEMEAEAMS